MRLTYISSIHLYVLYTVLVCVGSVFLVRNLCSFIHFIFHLLIFTQLHTVAQRQKVVGRSKPFRLLLAEHKKNKKLKKMEKRQSFSAVAPPAPLPPPTHLPAPPLTPPPM